jgi:hypothetical protein
MWKLNRIEVGKSVGGAKQKEIGFDHCMLYECMETLY